MRDHGEGDLLNTKIDILKFLIAQGANVNAQTRVRNLIAHHICTRLSQPS